MCLLSSVLFLSLMSEGHLMVSPSRLKLSTYVSEYMYTCASQVGTPLGQCMDARQDYIKLAFVRALPRFARY